MLDVFESADQILHQAVLALNRLVLVRLVVERLASTNEAVHGWEWMVWPTPDLADGDATPVGGCESSLAEAKRQALDAAITLMADLTRSRATELPSLLQVRQPMRFTGMAAVRPQ